MGITFGIDTTELRTLINSMNTELGNMHTAMINAFTTLKNMPSTGSWSGKAYSVFWEKCIERKAAFITYINFIGAFINDLERVLATYDSYSVNDKIKKANRGVSVDADVVLDSGDYVDEYEYSQLDKAEDVGVVDSSSVTEVYSQSGIETALSQLTAHFTDFCEANKALSNLVNEKVAVEDGALFGQGASSMKSAWDNHIKGITDLEDGIAAVKYNMELAFNNAAVTDQEIADAFGGVKAVLEEGTGK